MTAWARDALTALDRGQATALVTVLATEGSAPRDAGARMVVTADAVAGTIGGGNLEHQSIRQARALLARPPGEWRVQDYPLGPFLGQCCGGRVRVMLERLDPDGAQWLNAYAADAAVTLAVRFDAGCLTRLRAHDAPAPCARGPAPQPGDILAEPAAQTGGRVLIFGAGHVGQALCRALAPLPLSAQMFDTRPELAAEARILEEADLLDALDQAAAGAAVLIMTHDHGLDYRLARRALIGQAGFIGLIGSRTKRARFLSRLRAEGLSETALGRLTCPIGLPGVIGKEPAVIAAAVAAQLLMQRRPGP